MEDLVVLGGLVGESCESPLGGELICQRRLLNVRHRGLFIGKILFFTLGQTLTLILFWASICALICFRLVT